MRLALHGIRALLALALAALPLASAPAGPAPGAAALRQQLEDAGIRERAASIELARRALAGPLPPEDKAWFLDRLAADLLRLRRWQDALEAARDGQTLPAASSARAVRFATLQALALLGMGRPGDALNVYDDGMSERVAELLDSASWPEQKKGLEAQRTRASALLALSHKAEAMELLTQVLRRFDAMQDAEGQAETLHVIASLRYGSGDLAEARRAEQLAIDIARRAGLKGVLPRLHSLMSFLHAHAGEAREQLRELESARLAALEEGDEFIQAMVMFNLSDVAMQRRDWAQSLELSARARPIFLRVGDLNMAALCLANRGIALNRTGHPEGIDLIRHADEALAKRPDQESTRVALQKALAEELAFNRDFEQAYAAQLEYQRRHDRLHQADNQKRIAEAEAAYQADRRQRQIEALEHEHLQQRRFRWLWMLVGLLGVAAAAVVAVSRIYLKRAYRAVHDMALEDPLTRLHNRRYLVNRIDTELAQLRRERHQVLLQAGTGQASDPAAEPGAAFLLIDLDHFKSINDEHGHAAGDAVLRQASDLLRGLVRPSDTVVRWGGEEFLVFARLTSRDEAAELAERICSRIAAHAFELGEGLRLHRSCSVGFACYPFPGQGPAGAELPPWECMSSLADQCLYAAKANGRNQWVGILFSDSAAAWRELGDARAGLEAGHFLLQHRAGRELRWPVRERERERTCEPPQAGP